MRILFIHNTYQHFGGEDAVVEAEIGLLRSHGHEVELYERRNEELHHLSPAQAAVSAFWSRRAASEVNAICEALNPDVIHAHNTFLLISPSVYWVAARRNIPIVQTLHNFRLLCPQGTFFRNGGPCEDCLGKTLWRAVAHRCYRGSMLQSAVLSGVLSVHRSAGTYQNKVTRYIALSAFSRACFIAGGLPAARFRIKPNFVCSDMRPNWGDRQGGLFVGRLAREKGIETLLEAVRIDGNAKVDMVGSGPYAAAVAKRFGERYLGFLPNHDVARRMRSAAFLVLPSVGHEQMPMTVLEAFSCGLPVIASRLGALADIVEDGVTGLLINPGDAADLAAKIAWAEAHPKNMKAMGRAARADYEAKYTAPINYKILVDIYEDAIAAGHGESHVAQGAGRSRYLG
jgi:glycosyltransferase involved in cell wall biosynthesis